MHMANFLSMARRSITVKLILAVFTFYFTVIVLIALYLVPLYQKPEIIRTSFDKDIIDLLYQNSFDGKTVTPDLQTKIDKLRQPYAISWLYLYDDISEFSVGNIPDDIKQYRELQEDQNISTLEREIQDMRVHIFEINNWYSDCQSPYLCNKFAISGFSKAVTQDPEANQDSFFNIFLDIATSYTIQLILFGSPFILFLTIFFVTRPLNKVAKAAQGIRPADLDIRLDEHAVPLEVLPLVKSMNEALDRLDRGYNALGKFSTAAAHELRTPLTLFDVHLKEIPDSEARKNLRRLTTRLQQVIDQILYLSLMGRGQVEMETFDLIMLTRETIADRAPMLESDNIEIEFSTTLKRFDMRGMRMTIYAAITNLIDNAAKHSKDGDLIKILVDENGVQVIDNGPGLSEDFRPFAFEPFKKQDTQSVGFGLGLSIVEEIMKRHGGSVNYKRNNVSGTTFYLNLPQLNSP